LENLDIDKITVLNWMYEMSDWLQLMAGSNVGLCKYDNEKLCGLKAKNKYGLVERLGFSGRILCRNLLCNTVSAVGFM
jgi:hypothetical protein